MLTKRVAGFSAAAPNANKNGSDIDMSSSKMLIKRTEAVGRLNENANKNPRRRRHPGAIMLNKTSTRGAAAETSFRVQ